MAAQTVRDVIHRARFFHHQLQNFYDALKGRIDQPKLQLILDYLSQHEKRMEEALEEYEDSVARKVAETWFKYSSEVSVDEAIKSLHINKDLTLDDLMSIAVQLENQLMLLYRSAAEQAVATEVKDVFEQLLKETGRERQKLSRDLVDMQDLI